MNGSWFRPLGLQGPHHACGPIFTAGPGPQFAWVAWAPRAGVGMAAAVWDQAGPQPASVQARSKLSSWISSFPLHYVCSRHLSLLSDYRVSVPFLDLGRLSGSTRLSKPICRTAILRLAPVDDNLTALDHHFGIQHRIDVFQRIALKQNDVGHFAWLD